MLREHADSAADRDRSRKMLQYAVRSGRLGRPSKCEQCGTPCRPEGHHADYSRPLDVAWLCKACHEACHTAPPRWSPGVEWPWATAPELLRRWIRSSPLKHPEIAKQLGITPAHLSNVSNGKDGASPELRARISDLTGIRVTLWDEIEPALPTVGDDGIRREAAPRKRGRRAA